MYFGTYCGKHGLSDNFLSFFFVILVCASKLLGSIFSYLFKFWLVLKNWSWTQCHKYAAVAYKLNFLPMVFSYWCFSVNADTYYPKKKSIYCYKATSVILILKFRIYYDPKVVTVLNNMCVCICVCVCVCVCVCMCVCVCEFVVQICMSWKNCDIFGAPWPRMIK